MININIVSYTPELDIVLQINGKVSSVNYDHGNGAWDVSIPYRGLLDDLIKAYELREVLKVAAAGMSIANSYERFSSQSGSFGAFYDAAREALKVDYSQEVADETLSFWCECNEWPEWLGC